LASAASTEEALRTLEEFGKTPAKFAETVGSHDPEGCSMAVKKALTQAKVPATAPVKAGGKEIPLSEVTEKVCDAAQKVLDAAKNAAFDGLSPERAEEAKVWKGYTFYGKGKKELTTNAEKQKSPVWVFWDEVKGFSMPHWKLYHLKWSGKAFKRTELTGQGMEPPAKLFK